MAKPIQEFLKMAVDADASDLHITTYIPPRIRVHGSLKSVDHPPLTPTETKELIYSILTDKQKKMFEEKWELDFSFGMKDLGRFRANVFMQKGAVAGAFRRFLPNMWSFAQLGIPQRVAQLCYLPRGLVLVTGPTGCGKSTTLGCMIEHINHERDVHIVTIEDPIEYYFNPRKSIVNQRELYVDTQSYANALRSVLREDPDVVLVGEMRDYETVEACLRVAETGHLTFSTLHTNSAVESITRIIDIFPPQYQSQVRIMLSMTLEAVLTQSLLPRADGTGRVLAMEILIPNSAVRNLIRENKIHQIYSAMQMGQEKYGMQTFNQSLASLYFRKLITYEMAMSVTSFPEELTDIIQRKEGLRPEKGSGNQGSTSRKQVEKDGRLHLERQEQVRRQRRRRAPGRIHRRGGPRPAEGSGPNRQHLSQADRAGHPVPQAREGQAERARHLCPPALGPHRRRASPHPEPRHPRGTAEEQVLQEGHRHHQERRRGRLDPPPGQEEAPQGLRRPVLQPRRLGRAERLARRHAPAPGRIHREDGQTAGPGQAGHDLPRGHPHLCRRRRHLPPVEGHPRLRRHLHRARRGTCRR